MPMKTKRITKSRVAVGAGITGGLIFLLFFYFSVGLEGDRLFLLGGSFGTVLVTSIAFLLMNSR